MSSHAPAANLHFAVDVLIRDSKGEELVADRLPQGQSPCRHPRPLLAEGDGESETEIDDPTGPHWRLRFSDLCQKDEQIEQWASYSVLQLPRFNRILTLPL